MSTSIRNTVTTCERILGLVSRIDPARIPLGTIQPFGERVRKLAQVLSEHETRSLWLQTREGRALLKRIENQASKVEERLRRSAGADRPRVASLKTTEVELARLEASVEELRNEIEKRTYYVT